MAFDKAYYVKRKEDINDRFQKNKDKVINNITEAISNFQSEQNELSADYKVILDIMKTNEPTSEEDVRGEDSEIKKVESK